MPPMLPCIACQWRAPAKRGGGASATASSTAWTVARTLRGASRRKAVPSGSLPAPARLNAMSQGSSGERATGRSCTMREPTGDRGDGQRRGGGPTGRAAPRAGPRSAHGAAGHRARDPERRPLARTLRVDAGSSLRLIVARHVELVLLLQAPSRLVQQADREGVAEPVADPAELQLDTVLRPHEVAVELVVAVQQVLHV